MVVMSIFVHNVYGQMLPRFQSESGEMTALFYVLYIMATSIQVSRFL